MNKINVGIDISKNKFDVCWLSADGKALSRVFRNDSEGFAAFFNFLDQKDSGSYRIAIEATGWYGEDLARAAHDKGHMVFVINPAQIKYFGKSRLSRSKTDKKDARLIADFALTHPDLRPWVPLTASQEKLRSLFRHLSRLKEDHAQLLNRLESDRDEDVRKSSLAQLEFVQDLIRDIQGQIRAHIESDSELKVKAGLLRTIPGVGEMVCWGFLSETPDVRNFDNARQLAAFAGLNPSVYESGTSVRGRGSISKTGSSALRKLLYLPAMSTMRFNPVVKAFAETLRSRGKNGKVIVVACMRKLLHIIYGVLVKQQPFCVG
jgi:transposase